MRDTGITPDQITYTSLINACGRVKQMGRALEAYESMKKLDVKPDAVLFSKLIDICLKAHDPDTIRYLLDDMRKGDIEPSSRILREVRSRFPKLLMKAKR